MYMQPIKTSHGIAIIGTCFLITLLFINWAGRQIDSITLLIPASSQTAAVADFNSNLVAHYTFDDGTKSGAIGQAKSFNGTSDYVSLPASTVNFNNNYTVSFWLKPLGSFSGTIVRVSNSVSNTIARSKYEIRANGSSITFITGNGSAADSDSFSTSIPVNTWTNITCVHTAEESKSCYKNGQLISTATNDVDTSLVSAGIGLIGTNRNLAGNNFYEGHMDDVRIYSRVLSSSEIQELYALGSGDTTSPPPPSSSDTTPPSISSVSSSNITTGGATITWLTDEAGTSQVRYGPTSSYSSQTEETSSYTTNHSVTLSGLASNTTYNYTVVSKDSSGNTSTYSSNHTFTTQQESTSILPPSQSGACSSVSQWGITWYFDKEYSCGTFANGDWWVMGPVEIVDMTPAWDGTHNGWEINPTFSSTQGFYAGNYGYNAEKRPEMPFTVSEGSVVKVIGGENAQSHSIIKTAAVLTVLSESPAGGGPLYFRPPYSGSEKPLIPVSKLRTDLLPKYASVVNAPTLEGVREAFSKSLRMDHHSSKARQFRPSSAMADYQPENTASLNNAMLRLMLNDSIDAKMPALIQYTQHALDRAYIIKQGYRISPGTGHNPNHRVIAAWGAVMLDLEDVKTYLTTATGFHEDIYLFDGINGRLWGESSSDMQYWNYIMGLGGSRSRKDPYNYIDGGRVGDYQFITSQSLKGQALIYMLFPQLRSVVPTDKVDTLIKYADRWVTIGNWTQPDPCAPFDGNTANYGKTFGPDGQGSCIKDTNPDDGIGRFPTKHGTSRDSGQYKSAFVASMWDAYANSTPVTHTLTTTYSNGTITKSPNKSTYTSGGSVTLTATPDSGYTFSGWSGDASGTTNPTTVTMNGNKSVTATFTTLVPTNLAPTVSAGSDKSVALPQSVSLQGTATDDALPLNSTLSVSWSKVSGPTTGGQAGTVTFANPSSAITTATFSRQGTYVLRLTATDGSLSATDDVTITVTRANPTVSITSPQAGTALTLNTPVPVTVSASPPTGFTLSSVKLYDRNTLISTKTSSPWTFSFTPTTPGIHTLKAIAEDSGGASTDSSPISLTVTSTPPTSDDDQDGVPNSLDLCPKTIPPARAHVDTKGCPTPKADNFSIKPNWNTISSLISAPSLELGILNLGKVTLQRQQGILLVKSTQDSDDRLDFDSHLSFSQNKVTANPTELPLFSEPTTITLYNIDEIQPKILKDGTECSDCTITSYQDNTLIFTVPHFSTYEITEGYINPPNAPEPARTTGGGGGGGGRRLSTTSSATPATPTLCLPGYLFHPATGQRCSTQAQSIPGCLPNYLFSPITGQLCSLPASPRQSSTGATAGFPTANFTRDLALGSRGEDVRNLQIFLNTQGFTVSNQGVGSKGNETDYFGPATHSAVIRFQNYYRDDILTPVGLRSGTGYFGPSTMRKVNVLLVQ